MESYKKTLCKNEFEWLKDNIEEIQEDVGKRLHNLNQSLSADKKILELYNEYLENTIASAQSAMKLGNEIIQSNTIFNDLVENYEIRSVKGMLIISDDSILYLNVVMSFIEHLNKIEDPRDD
jgi:hypothetical protein